MIRPTIQIDVRMSDPIKIDGVEHPNAFFRYETDLPVEIFENRMEGFISFRLQDKPEKVDPWKMSIVLGDGK